MAKNSVHMSPIIKPHFHFLYFFQNATLVILAAVLFALAFPNYFFRFGIFPLGFFVLIPFSLLSTRIRIISAIPWGFFYGMLTYILFNYWLGTFNPLSFLVVPIIYGIYFSIVLPLFVIAYKYFGKFWFLIQVLIWMSYEYLRTQGFLGYGFGLLGYSMSFQPLLIQSADVLGVWMPSLIVAFPSLLIAYIIKTIQTFQDIFKNRIIISSIILYAIVFWGIVIYGIIAQSIFIKALPNTRTTKVALLQHNTDPWKGGFQSYTESFETLTRITEETMQDTANAPDIVVWSETAFVPSIYYHTKYRENQQYFRLIQRLMHFLEKYPNTEFLIGNGERIGPKEQRERNLSPDDPSRYNAALFFRGAERKDAYYKIHLVPFSESFPYRNTFRWFYNVLKENDAIFWLPGTEHTVFEGETVSFSTPICFEDGFGLQNAKFVRAGAQILINITNDAWSGVEANAMQHLQLSILRAIENRRSVVRSANSGMTAIITPNGTITNMLDSFTKESIVADIPIYTPQYTLYTRAGDWFAITLLILTSLCFLGRIVFFLYTKR